MSYNICEKEVEKAKAAIIEKLLCSSVKESKISLTQRYRFKKNDEFLDRLALTNEERKLIFAMSAKEIIDEAMSNYLTESYPEDITNQRAIIVKPEKGFRRINFYSQQGKLLHEGKTFDFAGNNHKISYNYFTGKRPLLKAPFLENPPMNTSELKKCFFDMGYVEPIGQLCLKNEYREVCETRMKQHENMDGYMKQNDGNYLKI